MGVAYVSGYARSRRYNEKLKTGRDSPWPHLIRIVYGTGGNTMVK